MKDKFERKTFPGYGACEYLVMKDTAEQEYHNREESNGLVALRNIWEIVLGRPAHYRPLKEYSPMLDEVEGDA